MSRSRPLSRRLHRSLGVALAVYFGAMALSGVLLNHPRQLAASSLPRAVLPGDYAYRDWNRNALRGTLTGPGGELYLYGEAGVWRLDPGQRIPVAAGREFEPSLYYRDTRALLSLGGDSPTLLAATRGGLWLLAEEGDRRWRRVPMPAAEPGAEWVDLVRMDDQVLALSRDRVYRAPARLPLEFHDVTPGRADPAAPRIPLFRLIFHAHSGATWGFPGRLAVDLLGVAVLALTATGAWFWWRRRRRTLARGRSGRWVRRGLRLHIRYGGWLAGPLLVLALTGLFQRPPFLIAVAAATYPAPLHPGPRGPNPWHDLLRKALYDPVRDELVVATADGVYAGPADLTGPLRPLGGAPPVSVMGATVFSMAPGGRYRVGSMSGLFTWDRRSGVVRDTFTGAPPAVSVRGPLGDHKVTGLVVMPDGRRLAADYFAGLVDLDGTPAGAALPQPRELAGGGRISLWHVLFELHNGRLFGFLLGWWTWLVVPLGGLALVAVLVSGLRLRLR